MKLNWPYFISLQGNPLRIFIFHVAFVLLQNPALKAQTATSEKHRYFGFGVNLNTLNSGTLRLNFDPGEYMRVEFQHNRYSRQRESWYYDQNSTLQMVNLSSKSTYYVLSALACIPFQHAKFFAGFSYQLSNSRNDNLYFDPILNYYQGVYNDQIVTNYFGLTLGGEYRFGSRFSLGADFSLLNGKELDSPGYPNAVQTELDKKITRTSLFIRFFPF